MESDYGELTENQKFTIRQTLLKDINYDPRIPANKMWANLAQIYAYEMYGKGKVSKGNESPGFLEKGTMAEPEAIKFLSKVDGIEYEKNEELFENDWFKGVPDIILYDENDDPYKIIEVKTSYDLPSFIVSMLRAELPRNLYEIMGYMDILKCKEGEIVHVLVDMPEKIVAFHEKRLKERYNWLEISEDVATGRIERTKSDMEYSGIPDEYKVFKRSISINGHIMKAAKNRVRTARKWMAKVDAAFTKKQINLSENIEENQEDSI